MKYKSLNRHDNDTNNNIARYTSSSSKRRALQLTQVDISGRLIELQDRERRKALLDYEQWMPENEIFQNIKIKVNYLGYILEDSFVQQLQSARVRDKILMLQKKIEEYESKDLDDDLQLFILLKLREMRDFIIEECGLGGEFD